MAEVAIGIANARRLDLDHLSAEIAQHGRRGGPGDEAGHVDDVKSLEQRRSVRHDDTSLHCMWAAGRTFVSPTPWGRPPTGTAGRPIRRPRMAWPCLRPGCRSRPRA